MSNLEVNGRIICESLNNLIMGKSAAVIDTQYRYMSLSWTRGGVDKNIYIMFGRVHAPANQEVNISFPIALDECLGVFVNSDIQGNSYRNNASCLSYTNTGAVLRQNENSGTLNWLAIGVSQYSA